MRRLRFRLPPPNGLVAFEAAGRLCSFTMAAEELNVTQAAVGRQVRALEGRLGVKLFQRGHKMLKLTAQGQSFHKIVSGGLEWIADAADELRGSANVRQLTIGTTHAFSQYWLLPRLTRLRQTLPNLNLSVISADNIDVIADGIDLGILFGGGKWASVTTTFFLPEEIFPVCSPEYLASSPKLRNVTDLLRETLLHPNDGHPGWIGWREWLAANDVDPEEQGPGIHFNTYSNAIQSALDGHGIALAWRYLHDDLLDQGLLIRPLNAVLRTDRAYYIACPEARSKSNLVSTFQDWLLSEAAGHLPLRESAAGKAEPVTRAKPDAIRRNKVAHR